MNETLTELVQQIFAPLTLKQSRLIGLYHRRGYRGSFVLELRDIFGKVTELTVCRGTAELLENITTALKAIGIERKRLVRTEPKTKHESKRTTESFVRYSSEEVCNLTGATARQFIESIRSLFLTFQFCLMTDSPFIVFSSR